MQQCNECNFENSNEAEFCENCGNRLAIETTIIEEIELHYCPECGEEIELGSAFCSKCGYSFGAKCTNCNAINQADAKFCENCSEPLEWICPACKNKNQVGATFCSECGSNSIVNKSQKWKTLSAIAVVLLVVSIFGISITQFNRSIKKAVSYGENNSFDSANKWLTKAQNSWLPFTDSKIREAKNYVNSQEEKYTLLQNKKQTASNRKQKSSSNSSSGPSSNNRQSYEKFATVDFKFYGSVKDASLRVESLNNNQVEINDGDSCYLKSYEKGINGQYSFTWRFDSNNNFLLDPKWKAFKGNFSIDGLHKYYTVYVSEDFTGSVSIEVKGY